MSKLFQSLCFSRSIVTSCVENVCQSAGFPLEVHRTTTEDGYILTLHRLLGRDGEGTFFRNAPILLQHGLWSSSDDWIAPGPDKSLGFLLARAGFDVWLGNTRGNNYSRGHVKLSPELNEFWDFSWHEMGLYDLPAMVDYILEKSGRRQLYFIGHSQGTTAFFVMASKKPDYNRKVKAMFAFAPVAYLRHMRSWVLQNLACYSHTLLIALHRTGFHKLIPQDRVISLLDALWTRNSKNADKLINLLLREFSFYATDEVKKNMKDIIISHMSTGASFKVLAHFAQCTDKHKDFRHFDYGPERNSKVYGHPEAPVYDLKNISVPIVAFYSDDDWLTHQKDLEYFVKCTRGNIILENVHVPNFNHLDFIWANIAEFDIFQKLFRYLYIYEKIT